MRFTTIDTAIGELLLLGDRRALHRLDIRGGRRPLPIDPSWVRDARPFAAALE